MPSGWTPIWRMRISGGRAKCSTMQLGRDAGSLGELTLSGGTLEVGLLDRKRMVDCADATRAWTLLNLALWWQEYLR